MYPSTYSSTTITSRPTTSRHSFSFFKPTPPQFGSSPPPPSTIAFIEERLAAIERILRMLLENSSSHTNHGTIINDEVSNLSSTTASHDSLRLPPLYNHQHQQQPAPSARFSNTNTSSSIQSCGTTSLLDSETSKQPLNISTASSLSPSIPTSQSMHFVKPATLSSPPPHVTTSFYPPHDPAATGQPSGTSVMTFSRQRIIQSSSSIPPSHTPSTNDHSLL
ncbi:unnamed protein product [Absidia cylindrospora]